MFEDDSEFPLLYAYVNAHAWNSSGGAIAYARFEVSPSLEGSKDQIIVIDSQKHQVLWRAQEIDRDIELVRWTNQDEFVVTVNMFGDVTRYEAYSGRKVADFPLAKKWGSLDLDPTNTFLAIAGKTFRGEHPFVEVYDIHSRLLVRNFDLPYGHTPSWLGWHPNGRLFLVLTFHGTAYLFDILSPTSAWVASFRYLPEKVTGRSTGCWVMNGSYLAIGVHSPKSGDVYLPPMNASLYEWASGTKLFDFPSSPGILRLASSDNRDLLAGAGNYSTPETGHREVLKVWSASRGDFVKTLRPYYYVTNVAWSAQGQLALGHTINYEYWALNAYYQDITIADI